MICSGRKSDNDKPPSLLQPPEYLNSAREWYRERIANLDTSTKAGKRARLIFFTTEGGFILRAFGFMDINQQEWDEIFTDIETLKR